MKLFERMEMLFGAHPDAASACTGFSDGVRATADA
jgi:hypothetical protein